MESILDLCEWVVKQPRDISILKNSNFDGSDPNWGWARKTIADLFIHGFKLTEGSFDILHQKRIWSVSYTHLFEKLEDLDEILEDTNT